MSNQAIHRKKKSSGVKRILHKKKVQVGTWVTRGMEIAMVLSSLFWAIEASARTSHWNGAAGGVYPERKVYAYRWGSQEIPQEIQRSPAAISDKNVELSHELASKIVRFTHTSDLGMMRSSGLLAPESLYFGNSLAPSFKGSPYYVSTSLILIRFP